MKRLLPHLALTLVVALLMLGLLSWLCSAAFPDSGLHSLLSGEGIRWFLGRLASLMATPVLVWILLLAAAWGAMQHSGMLHTDATYRRRRARIIMLSYLALYLILVALLALMPHAVLLSATGTLWPSPFSASLMPVMAFALLSAAVLYGIVAGTFASLADVYHALLDGLRLSAPLLLFYILLAQLFFSLCFVFA